MMGHFVDTSNIITLWLERELTFSISIIHNRLSNNECFRKEGIILWKNLISHQLLIIKKRMNQGLKDC